MSKKQGQKKRIKNIKKLGKRENVKKGKRKKM